MLRLNSTPRPGLGRIIRATMFSNSKSTPIITPSAGGGHTLSSRETIPSIGLKTWWSREEDIKKAIKVISGELFDQWNPDGRI